MPKPAAAPTHYQILKVKATASVDEIRAAYHRLAKKYHPDVNKSPLAAPYFKSLTEAFNVLKDPRKRAAYDIELTRLPIDPLERHMASPEMQKVYRKLAKTVQQQQADPVSAIFDVINSFIEPGTSVQVPLPGGMKLKLNAKQLKTIVSSADIVSQGLRKHYLRDKK